MGTNDPLAAARRAIGAGRWAEAVAALERLPVPAATAEGLELLAHAAYGDGQFERAVEAWERRYELCEHAGDTDEAGRSAAMVAMFLMMDTGLMAPVRGWLARADRLVEDRPDSPAQAIIAMTRTYERFMCGDMAAARVQSGRAIELGERLGVRPAIVIGSVCAARVTIYEGDIERGLAQLDEVGTWLMSGTADPLTTGMMYCELICAAQGLALHQRANEWTQVMDRWRHGAAIGGISGRCRVHRAEMLRMTGPCAAAEEEALGACDELRPWMRREFGWPLAELGLIRLRKGDLDGAEEAFVAAHEHAWSPHPGLALVRLERGDPAGAASLIRQAIDHPLDIPSKERPPFGELRLAPLLDAQVAIAHANHDAETARRATEQLVRIADRFGSPALHATAAVARSRTALVDGDPDVAKEAAMAGLVGWTDVGAPFEAAMARLLLGHAHESAGERDVAELEWRTAAHALRAFGALRWADVAQALADGHEAPAAASASSPVSTPPRTGVFVADGDQRRVEFGGTSVTFRDLKGYRYLERLLADPGREFHVLDLVAAEQGSLPTAADRRPAPDTLDETPSLAGSGLPVLDEAARRAYQRRLAEVDDDIDEARQRNDLGRLELAQRDREYLIAELGRAVGLGGSLRSTGSDAERARTAVTRSLRYSLARIAEHHPALADHLRHGVRTGTYCSYSPEAAATIDWHTRATLDRDAASP